MHPKRRLLKSSIRWEASESDGRRCAFGIWNPSDGAAMPIDMQLDIATRLVKNTGDTKTAIMECWQLAEANGWRAEAGRAEAFTLMPLQGATPRGQAFHVGWHGKRIGVLSNDGSGWRWEQDTAGDATPVRDGPPGRLPPFIESLLPEGWLERVCSQSQSRH